ncbi:MAG: sigma-70 region 4 domain-containing protein [Planctomycetota bacterium]
MSTPLDPVELIRRLKSGEVSGRSLEIPDRQDCVELLVMEGLSNPEVASVIGLSVSTVKNDKHAIKQRNAIDPDPKLKAEVFGMFSMQVEAATARLTRLAKDPAASVADKINANQAIVSSMSQFADRMIRAGYFAAPDGAAVVAGQTITEIKELVEFASIIAAEEHADERVVAEIRELLAVTVKRFGTSEPPTISTPT